jgi:hypothetical protein
MRFKNGIIFGVIDIIGNFATVFQDQAYWQRAIASRPTPVVTGEGLSVGRSRMVCLV